MSTFGHAADLRAQYPELVAVAMRVDGITPSVDVAAAVAAQTALARARLDGRTESELPEIAAWRRVFARMGLKPTQYRCASEALLRRLRMDGELPRIHPLVDLANAVSMATALPVCVIDLDGVDGGILVRFAAGDERYQSFGGEIERASTPRRASTCREPSRRWPRGSASVGDRRARAADAQRRSAGAGAVAALPAPVRLRAPRYCRTEAGTKRLRAIQPAPPKQGQVRTTFVPAADTGVPGVRAVVTTKGLRRRQEPRPRAPTS